MSQREFAIVFICQQGELEAKSLLLAASLRRFVRCRHELIAALPEPAERWGRPSERTLRLLEAWGIRTVGVRNPIDPAYPIGNKLACLSIPTKVDKLLFLDSDMLCLQPFADEPRFGVAFNAKPADGVAFPADAEAWEKVYALFGLRCPTARIRTSVLQMLMPPYFNAGFIAVNTGTALGEAWVECCKKIDASNIPMPKRPWLDQIALPVALHKLGLEYDCLDTRYNHPTHYLPLEPQRLPIFTHYHSPEIIEREPVLRDLVRDLARETPEIAATLAEHPAWRPLAEAASHAPLRPSEKLRRDLLITGIPRSGTSYLCNLLHRYDNCVALNEPAEIFPPLQTQRIPWGVAAFYRSMREDILRGRQIQNKLVDGKVVEDTTASDVRCTYTPKVRDEAFVLGVKNTLAFLNRLPALRQAMPWARIAVCIRDPFDTIASWKRSFAHLANADVRGIPVGHLADPWLSASQRHELEQVASIDDLAVRRAVYWDYLARLILAEQDRLILVRYDELVTRPRQTLEQILGHWSPGEPLEAVEASTIRSSRHHLDAGDRQAIRAACSESAAALGLSSSDTK